jgi:uncharacterized protein YndB with AHSA1/START domain
MVTLTVRRPIAATPERLFDAWTDPQQIVRWWGPTGVTCIAADVDLRVGGHYRIGNQLPDGTILWISGDFEVIQRPRRLTYTWQLEGSSAARERVTVQFEADGPITEVIVTHQRIATSELRDQHALGWQGCLEGLMKYVADATSP